MGGAPKKAPPYKPMNDPIQHRIDHRKRRLRVLQLQNRSPYHWRIAQEIYRLRREIRNLEVQKTGNPQRDGV